jgi:hypothetical protein
MAPFWSGIDTACENLEKLAAADASLSALAAMATAALKHVGEIMVQNDERTFADAEAVGIDPDELF